LAAVSITECESEDEALQMSGIGAASFTQAFGHLYGREDLALFVAKNHAPEVYARLINDPMSAAWLARGRDGAAAGYATAGPCGLPVPDMAPRSGELQRIYVLQGHQGGGLGAMLLKTALDWLEARFCHIYLSVYAENTGAQRFYARYGFEKVHDYFFMVGNHADPEFILKRQRSQAG